jgi:MurNAc alpha-1-phosphate uridylyltransferase
MVLAAGRGERMRPLTDHTPKPLLQVQGRALIDWHLQALRAAGHQRVMVNTAWLGDQFRARFSGGVENCLPEVTLSEEGVDFGGALETLGGIARALPQLAEVFWVAAADVFTPGFEFSAEAVTKFRTSGHLAHLWLVPNPEHNPQGDFGLSPEGLAINFNTPPNIDTRTTDTPSSEAPASETPASIRLPQKRHTCTFSTIALYRRELFEPPWCDIAPGNPLGVKAPLAPLLRRAMDAQRVSAELYHGPWTDVGTPPRYQLLNSHIPTTPPA